MGLEGPIPSGMPGHRIAPHIEVREFPARYLTPQVRRLMRLQSIHRQGFHLRDDPVLHWPARLFQALQVIEREQSARRNHG